MARTRSKFRSGVPSSDDIQAPLWPGRVPAPRPRSYQDIQADVDSGRLRPATGGPSAEATYRRDLYKNFLRNVPEATSDAAFGVTGQLSRLGNLVTLGRIPALRRYGQLAIDRQEQISHELATEHQAPFAAAAYDVGQTSANIAGESLALSAGFDLAGKGFKAARGARAVRAAKVGRYKAVLAHEKAVDVLRQMRAAGSSADDIAIQTAKVTDLWKARGAAGRAATTARNAVGAGRASAQTVQASKDLLAARGVGAQLGRAAGQFALQAPIIAASNAGYGLEGEERLLQGLGGEDPAGGAASPSSTAASEGIARSREDLAGMYNEWMNEAGGSGVMRSDDAEGFEGESYDLYPERTNAEHFGRGGRGVRAWYNQMGPEDQSEFRDQLKADGMSEQRIDAFLADHPEDAVTAQRGSAARATPPGKEEAPAEEAAAGGRRVPTEAEITARARANVEARDRLSGESDAQYKMRQQRGKVGGSIEARERRAVAYQQKLEAEENKLRNVASDRLKELTLADTEVRKAELMRDAAEGTITAKFMQRLKKDAADRLEKYVEANRVTQSNAWGNAAASAMFEKEKIELGDSNAETLRKPILAMFNDYTKGYEGGLEFIQILDSQGVHPLDMYNNRELLHYVAKRGFKDTHMEILLSALLSGKTSVLRADWEL